MAVKSGPFCRLWTCLCKTKSKDLFFTAVHFGHEWGGGVWAIFSSFAEAVP